MTIVQSLVGTVVETITIMVGGSATAIGEGIVNLILESETNSDGVTTITGMSASGQVITIVAALGFAVGLMGVVFGLVLRR